MTTIATKDGIIAYDSRATMGEVIFDNECNKKSVVDGVTFFIASGYPEEAIIIATYFSGESFPKHFDHFEGIAVDDGKVYRLLPVRRRLIKERIRDGQVFAVGTGWKWAIAAMDLGRTAKQAVEYAMTRDVNTGGKVKTFKV